MKKKKIIFVVLSILITASFGVIGYFVYKNSYFRTSESLTDLFYSIKYYICTLLQIDNSSEVTVETYSKYITSGLITPETNQEFISNVGDYFSLFFSKDNFLNWLRQFTINLNHLAKVFILVAPAIMALILVVNKIYRTPNNDFDKDTIPLKIYKSISNVFYMPTKVFLKDYFAFLKKNSFVWILWVFIWCMNLNLVTIVIEFLAYYFYFAMSYKFDTMYIQFVKLYYDLSVLFKTIPLVCFVPIIWPIFNRWRKNIAFDRLNRFELMNRGFINELPLVSMTCGSMGKKKTTLITDMALSQEIMLRDVAFERLKKIDMYFPDFPWISFENEIKKCLEYGVIYNLASIKDWVDLKLSRYAKHLNKDWQLYGYDCYKYGDTYNDNLKIISIFDAMKTYAQLYFIYVVNTSLIVSNYSIREDNVLVDEGNFPVWQSDFFPERLTYGSSHSHILDYDTLRLGKKLLENNPNIGSFEFGVVVISEIGKERGNNLELKEVKKGIDETNQKNDLFNSWLKMCRHSATVDNYPFIKVFTDEQRPESWGADARDLADIIRITSSSETRLALPFYDLEEWLNEWAFEKFIKFYYEIRYVRGDNTLLVHLLKSIVSKIYKYNTRIYNLYGYSISRLEKERGTMNGKPEKCRYYLMNKKIYSNRFSTDCFSDYFNDLAKKSKVGIMDYLEYADDKAYVEELKLQNSYFINALYKED